MLLPLVCIYPLFSLYTLYSFYNLFLIIFIILFSYYQFLCLKQNILGIIFCIQLFFILLTDIIVPFEEIRLLEFILIHIPHHIHNLFQHVTHSIVIYSIICMLCCFVC
jgi:hypothetical protein